jgi:hypothetical protein
VKSMQTRVLDDVAQNRPTNKQKQPTIIITYLFDNGHAILLLRSATACV